MKFLLFMGNGCFIDSFGGAEKVRLAVFEYIEGYYYNQRLHEGLGYRTPREVEEEYFGVR